jgi:hypothetical protein
MIKAIVQCDVYGCPSETTTKVELDYETDPMGVRRFYLDPTTPDGWAREGYGSSVQLFCPDHVEPWNRYLK